MSFNEYTLDELEYKDIGNIKKLIDDKITKQKKRDK
jgi:hypothetical protein